MSDPQENNTKSLIFYKEDSEIAPIVSFAEIL